MKQTSEPFERKAFHLVGRSSSVAEDSQEASGLEPGEVSHRILNFKIM